MADLEAVIQSAVDDAQDVETPDTQNDAPVETETTENLEASATTETPEQPEVEEVQSPAQKAAAQQTEDAFAKLHGISAQGQFGKENRIPYSRVKKIVSNAEKAKDDAFAAERTKFTTELDGYKTKVTDYEGRLQKVAEFEHIMLNDPNRFLQLISQIPAYGPIFARLQQPDPNAVDPNAMPVPDVEREDGSRVYSEEGVKQLLAWNARQVEDKLTQRYSGIEQEWQARQRLEALIPKIKKELEEARKWPGFTDNEKEIEQAITADPNLSLERAYVQVVYPKLRADRDAMRQSLLQEIKDAPSATSVTTTPSRPSPATKSGPKSMEDVMRDSLVKAGLIKA